MAQKRKNRSGKFREPKRSDSRAIVSAILEATKEAAGNQDTMLSTNEIARRAGVGIASLYRSFDSKTAILALLWHEVIRERQAAFTALALRTAEVTVQEAIRGGCEIIVAQDAQQRRLVQWLLRHVPREWVQEAAAEVDAHALKAVEEWIAFQFGLPEVEAHVVAFTTYFAAHGIATQWSLNPRGLARDQLLDAMVDLVYGALRTRSADLGLATPEGYA